MKNDVTFLAILIGLFVLAFLLVAGCDRIIARDSEALDADPAPGDPESDPGEPGGPGTGTGPEHDDGRTTAEEVAA